MKQVRLNQCADCSERLLRALHVDARHRLSTLHDRDEAVKEIRGVVWARTCFRVVLHAENRLFRVPEASASTIIEVPMRDFATDRSQ